MLHPKDAQYFTNFHSSVISEEIAPEDHYVRIQRAHTGGNRLIAASEQKGLDFVVQHIKQSDRCLIMGCGAGAGSGRMWRARQLRGSAR